MKLSIHSDGKTARVLDEEGRMIEHVQAIEWTAGRGLPKAVVTLLLTEVDVEADADIRFTVVRKP